MNTDDRAVVVLEFWWEAGPQKWFARDDAFDAAIGERFLALHEEAVSGGLGHWTESAHGALALLILLDQFPRNMFRGSRRAFESDDQALRLAESAVSRGFDLAYPRSVRGFFYMPFMHAEDIDMQQRCVDLCRTRAEKDTYHFALIHMDAIRRFGRFPHRNAVLGRETTEAEAHYLAEGGFSA